MLGERRVSDDDVAEVIRLVWLTTRHNVEDGDRNGALLCDADLAILGTAPQRGRRGRGPAATTNGHDDRASTFGWLNCRTEGFWSFSLTVVAALTWRSEVRQLSWRNHRTPSAV